MRASLSFQNLHRGLRRSLLGFLFCAAFAAGHPLAADPNIHLKLFLVVGPAFAGEPVFGGRLATALQEFLQRGLAVRVSNSFAALDNGLLEEEPFKHFSRGAQPGVQINRGHHGFKSVRKERRLLPAARLFFASA